MARKKKDQEEVEDLDKLADDLIAKHNTTLRYLRDYLQNHWKYVKIRRGLPTAQYEKFDESKVNLIKPLSSGNLKRIVKRLRQQIVQSDFKVDAKTHFDPTSDEAIAIDYIINNIILTDSTGDTSAFLQKIGSLVEDSLSFGFAPAFTSFETDLNGDPIVKLKPLMYADIFPEPDRDSWADVQWCFVRLWWSKADLKNMLDQGWIVDAVKATLEAGAVESAIEAEPEFKMGSTNKRDSDDLYLSYQNQTGYPILVYMEKKRDGDIVYLSPRSGKILFKHKNYDPSGMLRAHMMVNDFDSAGMLGHSLFETLMHVQEAQDIALQISEYNVRLDGDPALGVIGYADAPVYMRPGYVNYFQQGSQVAPIRSTNQTIDTVTMAQKMYSGLMTNATGVDDTSIPAAASASSQSKTDTGIKEQQNQMDIVTNYHDLVLKSFLATYIKNAFNVYVNYSKKIGKKTLYINDPVIFDSFSEDVKNDDGTISVDFDTLTLHSVDVSIGAKDFGSASDKFEAIVRILNVINSAQDFNPFLAGTASTAIELLNLKNVGAQQTALSEWRSIQQRKNDLNIQQMELSQEQMKLALAKDSLDLQGMQQTQQGEVTVKSIQDAALQQLNDLDTQAKAVDAQVHIAQGLQQLQQIQQGGGQPPEEGGM